MCDSFTTMSSLLKTVADNVRLYREKKGWTQTALARAVGRDQSSIGGIESASRRPGFSLLEKIASTLGIAPSLLFREGVTPTELQLLPSEIKRLLRLSDSTDPHLARLAQDCTRQLVRFLDVAEKGRRQRGRPKR